MRKQRKRITVGPRARAPIGRRRYRGGGNTVLAGGALNAANPPLRAKRKMSADQRKMVVEELLSEKPGNALHGELTARTRAQWNARRALGFAGTQTSKSCDHAAGGSVRGLRDRSRSATPGRKPDILSLVRFSVRKIVRRSRRTRKFSESLMDGRTRVKSPGRSIFSEQNTHVIPMTP